MDYPFKLGLNFTKRRFPAEWPKWMYLDPTISLVCKTRKRSKWNLPFTASGLFVLLAVLWSKLYFLLNILQLKIAKRWLWAENSHKDHQAAEEQEQTGKGGRLSRHLRQGSNQWCSSTNTSVTWWSQEYFSFLFFRRKHAKAAHGTWAKIQHVNLVTQNKGTSDKAQTHWGNSLMS